MQMRGEGETRHFRPVRLTGAENVDAVVDFCEVSEEHEVARVGVVNCEDVGGSTCWVMEVGREDEGDASVGTADLCEEVGEVGGLVGRVGGCVVVDGGGSISTGTHFWFACSWVR